MLNLRTSQVGDSAIPAQASMDQPENRCGDANGTAARACHQPSESLQPCLSDTGMLAPGREGERKPLNCALIQRAAIWRLDLSSEHHRYHHVAGAMARCSSGMGLHLGSWHVETMLNHVADVIQRHDSGLPGANKTCRSRSFIWCAVFYRIWMDRDVPRGGCRRR